jgi:hypothetical protein
MEHNRPPEQHRIACDVQFLGSPLLSSQPEPLGGSLSSYIGRPISGVAEILSLSYALANEVFL